jgi:hypothetical protein
VFCRERRLKGLNSGQKKEDREREREERERERVEREKRVRLASSLSLYTSRYTLHTFTNRC